MFGFKCCVLVYSGVNCKFVFEFSFEKNIKLLSYMYSDQKHVSPLQNITSYTTNKVQGHQNIVNSSKKLINGNSAFRPA